MLALMLLCLSVGTDLLDDLIRLLLVNLSNLSHLLIAIDAPIDMPPIGTRPRALVLELCSTVATGPFPGNMSGREMALFAPKEMLQSIVTFARSLALQSHRIMFQQSCFAKSFRFQRFKVSVLFALNTL